MILQVGLIIQVSFSFQKIEVWQLQMLHVKPSGEKIGGKQWREGIFESSIYTSPPEDLDDWLIYLSFSLLKKDFQTLR